MAETSSIEWTDATWNLITGCSVISPGCTNCYAMQLAGTRLKHLPSRVGLTRETKGGPVWTGEVRFNEQWLMQPLQWRRPRNIFVCAHGDLFHESVPDAWIDRVFAVAALAPQHTMQVLTKRAARMRAYMTAPGVARRIYELACEMVLDQGIKVVLIAPGMNPALAPPGPRIFLDTWPLPNVWLGVSTEDQRRADERVPDLLETPAAVRFVSAEPLLGPINFRSIDISGDEEILPLGAAWLDRLEVGEVEGTRLDWIIVGGESGKGARPMHPDWSRSIRDQCTAAGVPFFFKQWGSWLPICEMVDGGSDELYEPPPVERPDARRRCKVPALILDRDGARFDMDAWSRVVRRSVEGRSEFQQGFGSMTMFEVGKKAAGRLLDGAEHNAFPRASA